MNIVDAKYHLKRIGSMLWYRGFSYTIDYWLWEGGFYNSDTFTKIANKLAPKYAFYPRAFEIENTTKCHLKCTMCEHTYWDEDNLDLSFKSLKKIVKQFPTVKWIGLTGIGTSFLNPDFIKMVSFVKKEKGLYLELYDSFSLIYDDMAKKIIESGVDRMIVSIEGATKKTYEKIRVGASFDKVIENIRNLRKWKKKLGKHYPEITWHFVAMKNNMNELLPFVDLVKNVMGNENTSIYYSALLHPFPESKKLAAYIPDKIVEKVNKRARELGIKVAWNRSVSEEKEPITHCNEWMKPFIFADGTVIPCCACNEGNQRNFQRLYRMGNVFEQSFSEIWNGPAYQDLREKISKGHVPTVCKVCPVYEVGVSDEERHKLGQALVERNRENLRKILRKQSAALKQMGAKPVPNRIAEEKFGKLASKIEQRSKIGRSTSYA